MSEDGVENLSSCLKQSCHTSSNAHSKNCEGSPFAFVIHTVSSACIIRNTSPEALPTPRATRGGFHLQSNCTPRTLSCQGKYSQSYLKTPTASLYEHSFVEKTVLLVFPFSRKMFAKVLQQFILSRQNDIVPKVLANSCDTVQVFSCQEGCPQNTCKL